MTSQQEYMEEERAKKDALSHALLTRVLTDKEMEEVLEMGPQLFVRLLQVYREEDVQKRYLHALDVQIRIRKLMKP